MTALSTTAPRQRQKCRPIAASTTAADVMRNEDEALRSAAPRIALAAPFDRLPMDAANAVAARWQRPSEEAFEFLAEQYPLALIALIDADTMAPTDLTFAAEAAGRMKMRQLAQLVLLPLLKHPSALVREGAIYGLALHLDEGVLSAVRALASADPSPGVRAAARDLLDV